MRDVCDLLGPRALSLKVGRDFLSSSRNMDPIDIDEVIFNLKATIASSKGGVPLKSIQCEYSLIIFFPTFTVSVVRYLSESIQIGTFFRIEYFFKYFLLLNKYYYIEHFFIPLNSELFPLICFYCNPYFIIIPISYIYMAKQH